VNRRKIARKKSTRKSKIALKLLNVIRERASRHQLKFNRRQNYRESARIELKCAGVSGNRKKEKKNSKNLLAGENRNSVRAYVSEIEASGFAVHFEGIFHEPKSIM
jgi:hypothetical protein